MQTFNQTHFVFSSILHQKGTMNSVVVCFSIVTYIFLFGPTVKPLYVRSLNWPSTVTEKSTPKHKSNLDKGKLKCHRFILLSVSFNPVH